MPMFCIRCKEKSKDVSPQIVKTKNNLNRMTAVCGSCGCNKSQFVSSGNKPSKMVKSKRATVGLGTEKKFPVTDLKFNDMHKLDLSGNLEKQCSNYLLRKCKCQRSPAIKNETKRIGRGIGQNINKLQTANQLKQVLDLLADEVENIKIGSGAQIVGASIFKKINLKSIRDAISKVVKGTVARVKGLKNAVTVGNRVGYKPAAREVIAKYGDMKIASITTCRKVLAQPFKQALNFVTKITNREIPHDKLFHLMIVFKMEDGREIRAEKNEDLNIVYHTQAPNTECVPVGLNGPITLNELLSNTEKYMGADFSPYNAISNNCQRFVWSIITANNLKGDKQFVVQDVSNLIPKWAEKLAVGITTFKNQINQVVQGEGVKKSALRLALERMN